jgi:cell division protein FtsZ
MSIGQGHGVDKALRAVEQALNHPLLETASLENAAGILANFSAGNDLSLFEIEAALNYLQERTGNQAEIVMGVTNDCNLRDRVEVFLVITGLGAPYPRGSPRRT